MPHQPVPGNAKLIKGLNQAQILDLLRKHTALSRSELARLTGLTAPAVGAIVAGLLEEGILVERESDQRSTVGRRATPLEINRRYGVALGINLGISHANLVVLDMLGKVLERAEVTVESSVSPERVVRNMAEVGRSLLATARPARVLGVGVGLHGLVDHASGVLRFAPHFGWRDVPVAEMLAADLSMPVLADNGVRCMALGEQWFGAARGFDNFVCVAVGSGIGSAIVLDGRPYRGIGGTAGEIGHVTVDVEGPRCNCGSYGCLETLASGPAIARRAARLVKQGVPSSLGGGAGDVDQITAAMVARAAAQGDPVGRQVFWEAGTYLGIALANLVKTLNPEMILLGGGVMRAGDVILEPIRQSLRARAMDERSAEIPIRLTALGADSGAMGAAALVMERFFSAGGLSHVVSLM